ncbi:AmmeMemoRadiSam system protein B [Teredinibacter franksiae]|uniref:AmmeMemoRadiSam system protein B n=1 Tax=Teredinibacter franksiae TaxID=2761453 RepID=UPI001C8948BC|nr:AmmeMemoRadiSam system protein B [Teredinibacter franksiae]
MLIRPAAAAGTFYPASPVALSEQLDQLLAQYRSAAISNGAPAEVLPPKCLIVPHAGYVYSGPTAALAYTALADGAQAIDRVVLLGLSHRAFPQGFLPGYSHQQRPEICHPPRGY